MLERKKEVVSKLVGGMSLVVKTAKVTYIQGIAEAIDKNTIKVNDETYSCDNLVIATGSLPIKLGLPGFAEAREAGFLIDSSQILDLPNLPKKLVIIGGGVIGVEFANVFIDLDVEVVIIEGQSSILATLDKELSKTMTKLLSPRENLKIVTDAKVLEIKNGNEVIYEKDGVQSSETGTYCLEAIGRRPVTDGFQNIGLTISPRGAIEVNDNCETNIKGVYAVGDVFGKSMLAHVAQHAGNVVANQILKKDHGTTFKNLATGETVIPACIYTHPEIATVGLTEEQLKEKGTEYNSAKFAFAANGKALADDSGSGFVKILSDKKTKKILGAHFIGHRVTEMISEICLAMDNDLTVSDVASTIHPHPSMSEAIGEVAEELDRKS